MILRAEFVDLQEMLQANMTSSSQSFSVDNMESYTEPLTSLPWSQITDKPETFPPSAHTHPISDIIDLQQILNIKIEASDLAQVAFSGELSDLVSTIPTILYCGTSTEVIEC